MANTPTYHVESDPDLWKAREWVADTNVTIRVIQTCVGAYGAIDTRSGTLYFDVGDHLVKAFGSVYVLNGQQVKELLEEGA